jgi:phosphate transport system substrate-binding protein
MPAIEASDFPRLDGSTSAGPILTMIACKFAGVPCVWFEGLLDGERRLAPDVTNFTGQFPEFVVSGTHDAYLNLVDGKADLILVARQPSAEENARAALSGISLDVEPVALDAFVFIVNEDNPLPGLTSGQIRGIYTGAIKDWRDVGGEPAEIHPYQRDEQSGSQQLMRELVMGGARMIDAPDMILLTMIAPFYAVSTDPDGIGYSVYYYEERLAPQAEQVRLLAVDGILPDQERIASRNYPYTTEVYAVMRASQPAGSASRRLRDWLRSADGQALIAETGYVPLARPE